jgi:hypothetical protein
MGLSFDEETGELKQDRTLPQLMNISDDPYLAGSLVFYLHPDVETKVGSDTQCDLVLTGVGIKPFMCSVFLPSVDSDIVTLTRLTVTGEALAVASSSGDAPRSSPVEDASVGRVLVNGKLASSKCELHHTDRIIFGHSACFKLILPAGKKNLLNEDYARDSTGWLDGLREVVQDDNPDFGDYCAMIGSIQNRLNTETAEGFAEDFKHAWPQVEEGNLILSELRGNGDIKFMVEVTFDARTFREDYPELLVRLYHKNPDTDAFEVKDIFEFPHYLEILAQMKKMCFVEHVQSKASRAQSKAREPTNHLPDLCVDPWASFTHANMRKFQAATNRKIEELEAQLREARRIAAPFIRARQAEKEEEERKTRSRPPIIENLSRPKGPYIALGRDCKKTPLNAKRRAWNAAGNTMY